MKQPYLICIDDEPDVLDAVVRDLAEFEDTFPIESAENAESARKLIDELITRGERIGIIYCDHVMPGENGVDLLVELNKMEVLKNTRKILLTGQAGLDATVIAVNDADLAHYVAKPWEKENLAKVTKAQLAYYFVDEGLDPQGCMEFLDPVIMAEAIRKGFMTDL